jgi:hypothetical protein
MECFALFNIEYCQGEDLMQLFWGFWSVLQVGSNIAILGVMIQFWIVLGDVDTPSWAVALGTPVLVFAALGFLLRAIGGKALSRCLGKGVDAGGKTNEAKVANDANDNGDEKKVEAVEQDVDRLNSEA